MTDSMLDRFVDDPEKLNELPNPETVTEEPKEEGFPGPQGRGRSQVDLSIEANQQIKEDEHDVWWKMPYRVDGEKNLERQGLQDQWYQKYYGATRDEINREYGGFYPGANNPLGNLKNTFQALSVPG